MNCLVLSRYSRLGASSRVRFYQYIPYLEAHGVKVVVAPLLDERYMERLNTGLPKNWANVALNYFRRLLLGFKLENFDLLWVQSEFFPYFPFIVDRCYSPSEIPYVLDLDDAVFHRYDLHSSLLVRRIFHDKIDKLMHRAALVTAGNDYLAQRALRSGAKRVEILPSVVDPSRYPDKRRSPDRPCPQG